MILKKKFFSLIKLWISLLLSYKFLIYIFVGNFFAVILAFLVGKLGIFDYKIILLDGILAFSEFFLLIFVFLINYFLFRSTRGREDDLILVKNISKFDFFVSKFLSGIILLVSYFLILFFLTNLLLPLGFFFNNLFLLFLKILLFYAFVNLLTVIFENEFLIILAGIVFYFVAHLIPFLLSFSTGFEFYFFKFLNSFLPAFYLFSVSNSDISLYVGEFGIYFFGYLILSYCFYKK